MVDGSEEERESESDAAVYQAASADGASLELEFECERGCGFDGTRAEVEAHEETCDYDPRPFE